MQLTEVTTPQLAKEFLQANIELNKNKPAWICPLDKDVNEVFDEKKNKSFRFGEIIRWVLKDKDGKLIGRLKHYFLK